VSVKKVDIVPGNIVVVTNANVKDWPRNGTGPVSWDNPSFAGGWATEENYPFLFANVGEKLLIVEGPKRRRQVNTVIVEVRGQQREIIYSAIRYNCDLILDIQP